VLRVFDRGLVDLAFLHFSCGRVEARGLYLWARASTDIAAICGLDYYLVCFWCWLEHGVASEVR